jgi:hypothetical protein
MTCLDSAKLIPLYYYGDLSAADEERLEQHLHECRDCARELSRHRAVASALDRHRIEPPSALLEDCRSDLLAAIHSGAPRQIARPPGRWHLFLEAIRLTWLPAAGRLRQPAAALALLAIGFVSSKLLVRQPPAAAPPSGDQVFATVRSVQPDSSGRVQVAFDETRRRVVSGSVDDDNIRRLLLAAAREENPAVRVESMEVLKNTSDAAGVRDALLNAVVHDPNPGVRLKALEGLRPLTAETPVRSTLAEVLLSDDNPAVRMQAVDLLTDRRDDSMVGVLQNVVQREDNSYVRLKVEKALREMNASVGTF